MRLLVSYEAFAADIRGARPDADVAVRRAGDPVPADLSGVEFYVPPYDFNVASLELARRMPSLRIMQILTAGYEHILPYLPAGVTLCNAKGVHDTSTAELALGLTLASQRGLSEFFHAQAEGRWAHEQYPSLADRTVLILGYGAVGCAVEQRLIPFEVEVVRVARTSRQHPPVHGVEDLWALLPHADIVIVTIPLSASTRHLVDAAFLAAMKAGALLVNVARGGVVDTDALVNAVRAGRVRAALDVTDPEPLPSDHPLWSLPGVLISPHVGGNSTAFLPRARRLVCDQAVRFLNGSQLDNVVKLESRKYMSTGRNTATSDLPGLSPPWSRRASRPRALARGPGEYAAPLRAVGIDDGTVPTVVLGVIARRTIAVPQQVATPMKSGVAGRGGHYRSRPMRRRTAMHEDLAVLLGHDIAQHPLARIDGTRACIHAELEVVPRAGDHVASRRPEIPRAVRLDRLLEPTTRQAGTAVRAPVREGVQVTLFGTQHHHPPTRDHYGSHLPGRQLRRLEDFRRHSCTASRRGYALIALPERTACWSCLPIAAGNV
jgi:phosphoglycerate dehydrogenase-like enzyme